jgi:antitoxin component of MazEF toxin-antitoxin module
MIKTLTTVGNSKAVILPAEMVKKYNLDMVLIEETEDGILIRSAVKKTDFQLAVEILRKDKDALYKRIESQANDPETIMYYEKNANNFSDVDLDIIEE